MSSISPVKTEGLIERNQSPGTDSRGQLVDGLRHQLKRWGAIATAETGVFSCGAEAVDRLLPGGGLRHGLLVEWLGASSAATLALLGAREACREGGVLVVVDRARTFYPPAAAAWGIDLERLIVVHPQNTRDELWAAVQALRSPVVAALWMGIDRSDARAFRRLQLAAEAGKTLGVLVRPMKARGQPTWAAMRLEVEPRIPTRDSRNLPRELVRHLQVRLAHCSGARVGGTAKLEIDDAAYAVREIRSTHDSLSVRVVSELADSASRSHSARA